MGQFIIVINCLTVNYNINCNIMKLWSKMCNQDFTAKVLDIYLHLIKESFYRMKTK